MLTDKMKRRFQLVLTKGKPLKFALMGREITHEEAKSTMMQMEDGYGPSRLSLWNLGKPRVRIFKREILAVDSAGNRWKGRRLERFTD